MNAKNQTLFNEVLQHLEIEFSDYTFRKPLLEKKVNKIGYRQSKEYNFVVLEIKQYFKLKLFLQKNNEPQYTGNCYENIYITICNKKVQFNTIIDLEEKIKFVENYSFYEKLEKSQLAFKHINNEIQKERLVNKYKKITPNAYIWSNEDYKKELKELEEKEPTELEYKILTEELRRTMLKGLQLELNYQKEKRINKEIQYQTIPTYQLFIKWFNYSYHIRNVGLYPELKYQSLNQDFTDRNNSYIGDLDYYSKEEMEKELKIKLVKIRVPVEHVNYRESPSGFYYATNLKYWCQSTKKTSNKGLKAIHYRTYLDNKKSGSGNRGGWTFGGITIDSLKSFCRINGYKLKKDKRTEEREYKKHLYGDMANWVLHTLE
jgi:hypothetical protein